MAKNSTIATLGVNLDMQTAMFAKHAKKVQDDVGGIFKSLQNLQTGAAALGAAFGAGIILDGLGKFASGAKAALDTVTQTVMEGIERIDGALDAAVRLGTTTDNLVGLSFAAQFAGSSAEDLEKALGKLQVNLGNVDSDADPAAKAFARLGLYWKDLKGQDPTEVIKKVSDGMKNISSQADRLAILQTIAGKSAASLAELTFGGREAIEEMERVADAFGITFSQEQANMIGEAKDAMDLLGEAAKGLGNTLAIEVAPYITFASESILGFGTEGVGAANALKIAIMGVKEAIYLAMDGADLLVSALRNITGINVFFPEDDQWTSDNFRKLDSIIQTSAKARAEAAAKEQEEMRRTLESNEAFANSLEKTKTNSDSLVKSLEAKIATFGLGATELEIYKGKLDELDPEMANYARYLQDQLDLLEQQKKAQDELAAAAKKAAEEAAKKAEAETKALEDHAKGVREAARSNSDRLAEELARLNQELMLGLIDPFEHALAEAEAQQKYNPKSEKQSYLVEGLQYGSVAASTAIMEAKSGGAEAPMKELNKTAKSQLTEAEKQTRELEKLAISMAGFGLFTI